MDAHPARSVEVVIEYEGKDISRDIAPYLISFSYTDNASDKADDISVTLEDREGRWRDPWFPSKGDVIKASILTREWDAPDKSESLPCGTFTVDEIECSGPPTVVVIKGVSALTTKPMCREKHDRAWENAKLSTIAADIANGNGLKLFWDSSNDPFFERRQQDKASDMGFLKGLCRDYGLGLKVTDKQLVCYDEESYEDHEAVTELKFGDKRITRYRFKTKTADTYKAARVRYHHPVKGETIEATEEDEDAEGNGRDLEINERVDTIADAKTVAKKRLREANKREITGKIDMMGDLRFVGGQNVTISGFGKFSGKYAIDKATHNVTGGYTTSLELRMGGKSKKAMKKKKKADKSGSGRLVCDESETYQAGKGTTGNAK